MIRRIGLALGMSTLAVFVVACSGAPSPESDRATSSELVKIACTTPFTVAEATTFDETRTGKPITVWSCSDSLAAPGIHPAGGSTDGTINSCDEAPPQEPPYRLARAGCTWGRRTWSPGASPEQVRDIFLCPRSAILPPSASGDTYERIAYPRNGCFGDSLDSDYGYVLHSVDRYTGPSDGDGGGTPGNCGASCGGGRP